MSPRRRRHDARVRWWISRLAPAIGYAVTLLVVGLVMTSLDDAGRRSWVAWTSTNLDNLGHHPLLALLTSAFVVEDGAPYAWVALAVAGLVSLAWRLGTWRTVVVVAAAHVIGTAVSEGIVAWQVHRGTLPGDARSLVDVGPSYVVVSALVGAVVTGPTLARLAGASGFGVLAPSLFGGITDLDVAAVGHVCSILLGAALAFALLPRPSRRPSGQQGGPTPRPRWRSRRSAAASPTAPAR